MASHVHVESEQEFTDAFYATPPEKSLIISTSSQALAIRLKTTYEILSTTKFIAGKTFGTYTKNGVFDLATTNSLLRWEHDDIGCDGIPFFVIGTKLMGCQNGKDYDAFRKEIRKAENAEKRKHLADHPGYKERDLQQTTKKMGCRAKIRFFEVIKFPSYQLDALASDFAMKHISISRALKKKGDLSAERTERKIYVIFSPLAAHTKHPIGREADFMQPIDVRLINRIHELVAQDPLVKPKEVVRLLDLFVQEVIKPHEAINTSRRFKPQLKDIENHVMLARMALRTSTTDQDRVGDVLQQWAEESKFIPDQNYFFRPATKDAKLLIVMQSNEQRRLLQRFGQEVFLIDATYKTTKYALPLFTLSVESNIGYLPVAFFVTADETTAMIKEALGVLLNWNPQWRPNYAMSDFSEAQIAAVETTWPECRVLLCKFHRKQAWLRWFNKIDHGVSEHTLTLMPQLNALANATTEAEFTRILTILKESPEWQLPKFQSWFENKWLSVKERWVWAYRKNRINNSLNTTNGLESLHNVIKNTYLSPHKSIQLSVMLGRLLNSYLPDVENNYRFENIRRASTYKIYAPTIPAWLHNRPKIFGKLCKTRDTGIPASDIVQNEDGTFAVRSGADTIMHTVHFGNSEETKLPSCGCWIWEKTHKPCQHFLAIFKHFSNWGWDKLPTFYTSDPRFILDENVLPFYCRNITDDITSIPQVLAPAQTYTELLPNPITPTPTQSPKQSTSYKNATSKCQEKIHVLISCLQLSKSKDDLENLHNQLEELIAQFRSTLPQTSEGLLYEKSETPKKLAKRKSSVMDTQHNKVSAEDQHLPVNKKRRKGEPVHCCSNYLTLEEQSLPEVVEEGVDTEQCGQLFFQNSETTDIADVGSSHKNREDNVEEPPDKSSVNADVEKSDDNTNTESAPTDVPMVKLAQIPQKIYDYINDPTFAELVC